MGEDILNQWEEMIASMNKEKAGFQVSSLPTSWSTDLFPKTKSIFLIILTETIFVNWGMCGRI